MDIKKIFLLLMTITLTFTSCEKDLLYSCDEVTNAWVKENINDIKVMTRSTWVELPENLKGPTFGAFSSEQKSAFWNERINEILLLDWEEKEEVHLKKLQHAILINNHWFNTENRTFKDEEEMLIYAYIWIDYAKEELKWDDSLIFAIVGSGNKIIDKSGEQYTINNTHSRLKNGSERNCNCNKKYNFCGRLEPDCLDTDCIVVPYCGWLLLSECNGLCGIG